MLFRPLLLELAELAHDGFAEVGADRVVVLEDMLDEVVEQPEQVLAYLLRVRGRLARPPGRC